MDIYSSRTVVLLSLGLIPLGLNSKSRIWVTAALGVLVALANGFVGIFGAYAFLRAQERKLSGQRRGVQPYVISRAWPRLSEPVK